MDKKYGSRGEDNKQEHVNANLSETVITGLHSETTESEVINMLKNDERNWNGLRKCETCVSC